MLSYLYLSVINGELKREPAFKKFMLISITLLVLLLDGPPTPVSSTKLYAARSADNFVFILASIT